MTTTKEKTDVYQIITDRIIAALEAGTVPWRKPWNGGGSPRNLASGKEYRGINWFLLSAAGYSSPYWLTFKQAIDKGGNVKKGEKGMPVTYWNFLESKTETDSKGNPKKIGFLKYFTAFNLCQCEGIEVPAIEEGDKIEFAPEDAAEIIIARPGAKIEHGSGKACYSPSLDLIRMPARESFHSVPDYYGTAFHELVHWTGHSSRLNRGLDQIAAFGDAVYSKEELVAEMGAAFLCAESGLFHHTEEQSAAYVAGWLKALRGDSRLVIQAASAAGKAADLILGKAD